MGTSTVLTPSIVPVRRNFCSLSPWRNMSRKGMVLSKVLNPVPGPNVVATRFRRMLDCMACTSGSYRCHPLQTLQQQPLRSNEFRTGLAFFMFRNVPFLTPDREDKVSRSGGPCDCRASVRIRRAPGESGAQPNVLPVTRCSFACSLFENSVFNRRPAEAWAV